MCERWCEAAAREAEAEAERDTESKTRTPHKDVGENSHHMKHKKTHSAKIIQGGAPQ